MMLPSALQLQGSPEQVSVPLVKCEWAPQGVYGCRIEYTKYVFVPSCTDTTHCATQALHSEQQSVNVYDLAVSCVTRVMLPCRAC